MKSKVDIISELKELHNNRVYDSFALVEMEVADQFFYSFPFATAFGCS